ncbi:GNAT family N-acetyltransferase [Kiloniella sp. EL199]|uniref:GNAT family N-acetyltransferase n=1 Tax=Kiloniella sp. EL199 TaxID=2107581 RepID=UPI000EA28340|nr:GNAT family N-acetyltransferase [Kiloniella sp. EL199]
MKKLDQKFKQNPVTDTDASSLIKLIKFCYEEYKNQGVIFDIQEETELLKPASHFAAHNGKLLGIRSSFDPESLVAVCGFTQSEPRLSGTRKMEFKKLYVSHDYRGHGLAQYLVNEVIKEARHRNIAELFLWTDSRFTKAHQLYKKLGFIKQNKTRKLSDKSNSEEFCYCLHIKSTKVSMT